MVNSDWTKTDLSIRFIPQANHMSPCRVVSAARLWFGLRAGYQPSGSTHSIARAGAKEMT
jgi:hypothetical protein